MKTFKLQLLIIFLIFGCQDNSDKEGDARFWDVDTASIISDSLSIIDISTGNYQIFSKPESYIGSEISLGRIISDVRFLELSFIEGRFLGGIDKMQYDDDVVVVLDKFQTKSLNVFDLKTGKQLFYIESGDTSPFGPYSIDDFDYDSYSRNIFIYDENKSSIFKYHLDGSLIENTKINFAFRNLAKIGHSWIFYTLSHRNGHLGTKVFSNNKIFITDATFRLHAVGLSHPQEHWNNNYIGRDYFQKQGGKLYFMPRFETQIYEIDTESLTSKILISYPFQKDYVSLEDIARGEDHMIRASASNGFYYSNGKFLVLANGWVFAIFETWKNQPLLVFHNLSTGESFAGTRLINPPNGLPFFSSPMASYQNTALGFLHSSALRAIQESPDYEKHVADGVVAKELDLIINNKSDIEDQVLVLYTFK